MNITEQLHGAEIADKFHIFLFHHQSIVNQNFGPQLPKWSPGSSAKVLRPTIISIYVLYKQNFNKATYFNAQAPNRLKMLGFGEGSKSFLCEEKIFRKPFKIFTVFEQSKEEGACLLRQLLYKISLRKTILFPKLKFREICINLMENITIFSSKSNQM